MSLGEFAMLLAMIGVLPYIAQIVWGHVRPERATWLVWSLILALALWSHRSAGANDSVWFLVGDFIVTITIFLLSLWRGKGGLTKLDMGCMVIAACSLVLWQLSDSPLYAVAGVLIADAAALVPTLIKSVRDPLSESALTYSISGMAAGCAVLSVGQWSLVLLVYPVYILLADVILVTTLVTGRYHTRHSAA